MRFLALLGVVALIPIVGVGGYVLNSDPNPPTLNELLTANLKSDGAPQEYFVFIFDTDAGTQALGAEEAVSVTDAQLRENGIKTWQWRKITCQTWSTSGDPEAVDDANTVQRCHSKKITRKAALAGVSRTVGAPGVPLQG